MPQSAVAAKTSTTARHIFARRDVDELGSGGHSAGPAMLGRREPRYTLVDPSRPLATPRYMLGQQLGNPLAGHSTLLPGRVEVEQLPNSACRYGRLPGCLEVIEAMVASCNWPTSLACVQSANLLLVHHVEPAFNHTANGAPAGWAGC